MDLFEQAHKQPQSHQILAGTPLAEQMRPRTIEEMVGQDSVLRSHHPIQDMLKAKRLISLILWGPPGCGKTTFAELLAQHTQALYIKRNAVDTGAKDLRELGEESRKRRLMHSQQTLLFIDEIHRLNKAQQDVLLPFVERGDLILVGATTENPSFEVNPALLSRCRLTVFEKLKISDLQQILSRTIEKTGHSISHMIQPDTQELLLGQANGDARRLLNMIEQILIAYENKAADRKWPLSIEGLKSLFSAMPIYYNRGDAHYDTASAFIKSIRASDADAGIYYLSRMLEAGEDPHFIARRLVVLASEDIGNADPRALMMAIAGQQALDLVGLPEAAINLAQVVTYLATAPKSNRSYVALKKAQEEVKASGNLEIPLSIRNAPTQMMKDLGYSQNYQYAHNSEKGYLPQPCLPDAIQNKVFYEPSERGFEKQIKAYMEWLKKLSE